MTYLFVRHLCDQVIVMRGGAIVEQGPTETVMCESLDAYTRDLIAAADRSPMTVETRAHAMEDAL